MKNDTKKFDVVSTTKEAAQKIDVLLEKEDLETFKSLIPELRDAWTKKQIYRTETEAEFSVLNDAHYPTPASKYWQCVREQDVYFKELIGLSFQYRDNDLYIEELEEKIKNETNRIKKARYQIRLEKRLFDKSNFELTAKDRIRELKMWSDLKKKYDNDTFDKQNVNTHQALSYKYQFENRKKSLSKDSPFIDKMNVYGQLSTLERMIKEDPKLEDSKRSSEKKKIK